MYAFAPGDHEASGTLMEGTFLVNFFPSSHLKEQLLIMECPEPSVKDVVYA